MQWAEYIPVRVRKERAARAMEKLQKTGIVIEPVKITGRLIAKEFWGKKWCEHLESYADFANRLPRGRTYARNGSICHLRIQEGEVTAIVSGSSLYNVSITITKISSSTWEEIKKKCSHQIGSILELLQAKLSTHVMGIVADHKEGLFPHPHEITSSCSCPDWATICKHVAAVLYGIAHRLDQKPDLLFVLRGVNAAELVQEKISIEQVDSTTGFTDTDLEDLFGIDIDTGTSATAPIKASLAPAFTSSIETLNGPRLTAFRVKKGWTIAELAQALDVTTASIYRWEKKPEVLHLSASSNAALSKLLQSS